LGGDSGVGFCGAGFGLRFLVIARTKGHRLKPAPLLRE
jgi:hypothetical protein